MANAQEACVYASFILDGGDAASIVKVCKAAGIDVPQSLADAFGKTFASKKLADIVKSVSVGGGSAAPAAAAAAPAAAAKKEEPKKEDKKAAKPVEDDDDLFGGGLF